MKTARSGEMERCRPSVLDFPPSDTVFSSPYEKHAIAEADVAAVSGSMPIHSV